jgi:hypothetical protein
MSFEQNIQQWVSIDNQLKIYNDKIRELRERRSDVTEAIMEQQSTDKNLAKSIIQISDGKLKITESRVPEPLTYKYLEKCLSEIIKSEDQVTQIMDYVKKKREIKVVSEIKRYSNN